MHVSISQMNKLGMFLSRILRRIDYIRFSKNCKRFDRLIAIADSVNSHCSNCGNNTIASMNFARFHTNYYSDLGENDDEDQTGKDNSQPNTDQDSPIKMNRNKKRQRKLLDSDEEEDKKEEKSKEKKKKSADHVKSPEEMKLSKVTKTYKSKGNVTVKQESDESNNCDEGSSSPEKPEELKSTQSQTNKISNFFAPIESGKKDKNTSLPAQDNSKQNAKPTDPAIGYNPSDAKYHPVDSAFWKHGEKVPYLALAKTLEAIEAISGRLKMIEILANFFRSVIVLSPDDFLHCVYLCLNRLAPAYEGVELGVGDNVLMKAIAQATGRNMASLKSELASKGDIGLVAEASRSNQRMMMKPAPLSVKKVFEELTKIAVMSGHSSMTKKTEKIQSLLVACRYCEARYLVRSLSGKLRIGLAEQSLLVALAQAVTLTPPTQDFPPEIFDASKGLSTDAFKKKLDDHVLKLKTAYCECPNYGRIISVLLSEGIEHLNEKCTIVPGIPLQPMLAQPTKGVEEVFQRFEKAKFICEYKYDGERAQIHVCEDGSVKIFSRNQENNTSKYPDIVGRIPKVLDEKTKTCIIDAEAVAWDKENGQILPFQVLSTRKRKDANEADLKVQVCLFAFDLLYLNGQSLVQERLETRRQRLTSAFKEKEGQFMFAKSVESDNLEDIQNFLDESVKGKCEGLMVKSLDVDATYEISKRSRNWLKLKKDYLDGVGDTLDLVVVGGYFGKGKRTGNYGGFLLACYDPDNEEYQTICKIGTGFKDEDFVQHSLFLKQHVIESPKSYYRFDSNLIPDEWFEACQVWEVKCADLSISPVHKAAMGIVDPEKGVSLRFPRYLRIRDDKKPEDATTAEQVADLYRNQEQIKSSQQSTRNKNEEDFY